MFWYSSGSSGFLGHNIQSKDSLLSLGGCLHFAQVPERKFLTTVLLSVLNHNSEK